MIDAMSEQPKPEKPSRGVNGLNDVTLTPKQRSFLTAYALCGRIGRSAETAKVNRLTHHCWLKESADYQRAFSYTAELIGTMAEDAAVERGIFGVKRLVLHQGTPVKVAGKLHYEVEHSDALLLAVLRKFKPEYRERIAQEHSGRIDLVERLENARARLIRIQREEDEEKSG
jgi:hypothetical protein